MGKKPETYTFLPRPIFELRIYDIWRFPKSWGYPKSSKSIRLWLSIETTMVTTGGPRSLAKPSGVALLQVYCSQSLAKLVMARWLECENVGKMMYILCQNLVPLVNIKIAGKWMFISPKNSIYRYWSMAMYILWMEEILHQWFIPLFRGFQASKAVQDFFNPQYGVVMITRIIVHTDPEVCPSPD